MDMPFYSQAGIEFTYLVPKKRDELIHAAIAKYQLDLSFKKRHIKTWVMGVDESAVEIASPPFPNLEEAKKYYSKISPLVEEQGLITHRRDSVSGGGHVHIQIKPEIAEDPMLYLAFLINVYRDVNNRPYLNWIFNEPHNVKSAQSFYRYQADTYNKESTYFKLFLMLDKFPLPFHWTSQDVFRIFSDAGKGYACRIDAHNGDLKENTTLEFRFFDAKKSWEDVRRHLNFANAYMKYLEDKTLQGILIPTNVTCANDIKAARVNCIPNFKHLLKKLGLNYSEYDEFVKNNYEYRERINKLY